MRLLEIVSRHGYTAGLSGPLVKKVAGVKCNLRSAEQALKPVIPRRFVREERI